MTTAVHRHVEAREVGNTQRAPSTVRHRWTVQGPITHPYSDARMALARIYAESTWSLAGTSYTARRERSDVSATMCLTAVRDGDTTEVVTGIEFNASDLDFDTEAFRWPKDSGGRMRVRVKQVGAASPLGPDVLVTPIRDWHVSNNDYHQYDMVIVKQLGARDAHGMEPEAEPALVETPSFKSGATHLLFGIPPHT